MSATGARFQLEASQESHQPVVAKLLKRLDNSAGFAGLGSSIRIISRLGEENDDDTKNIASAILQDAALTAKLLRIANSSRYARAGGNVSTIDQVLAILGLNTVKSVALSLALLGSLSHKPQSRQLHAEIVAAYFCGSLAYQITRAKRSRYSAQEAQVCGLMQNLGRMMSLFYLYEDIEHSHALQARRNITENEAVIETLGTSYETIGSSIARHWHLPEVLQKSLLPETTDAMPLPASNALGWHQTCSAFCRRITAILFRLPENREAIEIANCIDYFNKALHLQEKEMHAWIAQCLDETDAILSDITFPLNVGQARALLRKSSERALDMLSPQDALVKGKRQEDQPSPVDQIKHYLRLIHNHYNFDRTLICLPVGPSNLIAIGGVGRNVAVAISRFRCGGTKPDLFRIIASRKQDTFVPDVHAPIYAKLIPDWYHEAIGARSFLILPLASQEKLLGLVYGDYPDVRLEAPQGLTEGNMLEWRRQILLALQSGASKMTAIQ